MLVCTEEEVSKIFGKIKAVTAKEYNRTYRTEITRGHVPLSDYSTYIPLWTQKFGCKEIGNKKQLANTIVYIKNNRLKHELVKSNELQKLSDAMLCTHEQAFTIEYRGGFDVVVGNPPYVRMQNIENRFRNYYDSHYKSAYKNYDLYLLFAEITYNLLSTKGYSSFIMPNKFITTDYGLKFKEFLYQNRYLYSYTNFSTIQIFQDATTYTGIFVFKKSNNKILYRKIDSKPDISIENKLFYDINYKNIASENWMLSEEQENDLFHKLSKYPILINSCKKMFQGLVTGKDSVFVLEKQGNKYFSKYTNKSYELESDSKILKPLLKGSEIKRYMEPVYKFVVIYPYFIKEGKAIIIDENTFKNNYSKIWQYLNECKNILANREKEKFNNNSWYQYSRNQNIILMPEKKIITQVLAKKSSFTYDLNGFYSFVGGGTAGGYGITMNNKYSIEYSLCLFNSKLIGWYIKKYASPFKGGYYAYSKTTMSKLPFVDLNLDQQQPFIEKVDLMLSLNKNMQEKKRKLINRLKDNINIEKISQKLDKFYDHDFKIFLAELKKQKIELSLISQDEWQEYFDKYKAEINQIQEQIAKTDQEIDQMVYELYGLTDEEIKIVEEATK